MRNVANTIEDLLEIAAGFKEQSKIALESNDSGIIHSIARQVFKGTALTDRQFSLMKEKLITYKDQFTVLEYDFDNAVTTLRQPLREIDRSKYIELVGTEDVIDGNYESYKDNWKWIKIRFPFSKQLILSLESVKPSSATEEYYHAKGSHEHYIRLTEKNAYNVLAEFINKESFNINQELLEYFNKIVPIKEHPENYLPMVTKDGVLKNINPNLQKVIEEEIDPTDVTKVIDRKFRYGIKNIDYQFNDDTLETQIANRDSPISLCDPKKYNTNQVLTALMNLDRFPMVVVCNQANAQDNLYEIFEFFKYNIPREEQAVLFRLENDSEGKEFNQYIKDKKLNNWVDKNTKIVYINNKLPKVLFTSGFAPVTAFVHSQVFMNAQIDAYVKGNCDLVVMREEAISPMRKYSRYYGKL